MKKIILIAVLLISVTIYSQEVKEFNIKTIDTYRNGYVSESTKAEGKATLKLYENSGTLIIQFTDGETKFTFNQYKYVLDGYFVSVPKAKFYNGGKYLWTGELLINLKGTIKFKNPDNGYELGFN